MEKLSRKNPETSMDQGAVEDLSRGKRGQKEVSIKQAIYREANDGSR